MAKILPWIMMIVFLSILVGSVIYLTKRFTWVFGLNSKLLFGLVFSFIPVFFMTAGIAFMNSTAPVGHMLYKLSAILMGVYLFLVLSVLLIHLVTIFYKLSPLTFGIAALGLTLLISLYGYWQSTNTKITSIEVPMEGLSEDIKAVHLSDIHIGHFRTNGFLDRIVEQTNEQNADLIFITGDYLDSRYALRKEFFEPLRKLNAPVYFVDGNHDHSTNNDSILTLMKSAGVTVLENETDSFGNLQIVGLSHMIADRNTFDMHASGDKPTIEEILPQLNVDKSKPALLLHHSPSGVKYAQKAGIDIYLSGHTHAGQIFPLNLISNMIFDYNRGLHDFQGMKVFVSEGIGTFGPPFRIGTKSEIVVFHLKQK